MRTVILILTIALCFSCEDEKFQECHIDDPVNNIPELKAHTDGDPEFGKFVYITEAEYQDKRIYLVKNCCPYCSSIVPVYNCSGEVIGTLGSGAEQTATNIIPDSKVRNEHVIWKHADSICTI